MFVTKVDVTLAYPRRESLEVFSGEWHKKTLMRLSSIIRYQWRRGISDGIRGFVFSGPPGVGKTWMAWQVANELGILDLSRRNGEEYVMYRDCADLAFPRYGETEKQIRTLFYRGRELARRIKDIKVDYGVLYIFDDAEALFLTRSFGVKLETWYLTQLNVFFHEIDRLDTSNQSVILITNREDLLDEALLDRFYPIRFPLPDRESLTSFAKETCRRLGIDPENAEKIIEELEQYLDSIPDSQRTFRQVRRFVTERYVGYVATLQPDSGRW